MVRIVGHAPLTATVYALERLRCNLCGEIFTAEAPEGVWPEKYDATTASMIALLKYGSGVRFHRLVDLQEDLEIPLSASTQWEIVAETATVLEPALDEAIRQAARGAVLHNDDTRMPILALRPTVEDAAAQGPQGLDRTGIFTSGIVATGESRRIALFFTGRRHAGENLAAVLARRAAALGPPIQMCDAVTRNLPKPLEVILTALVAPLVALVSSPAASVLTFRYDSPPPWMLERKICRSADACRSFGSGNVSSGRSSREVGGSHQNPCIHREGGGPVDAGLALPARCAEEPGRADLRGGGRSG